MTAAPPPYFPYDVEALNAALQKNMNYRFACDIAAAVEEGNFSRALQTLGSMGVRHSQTYNRKRHNPLSAVADQPHPVPGMQEVIRQHAAEIDEDIARTQQAPKNGASTEFDQLIDLLADGKAEEALAELDRVMPRHAERFVLSAQPEVIRADILALDRKAEEIQAILRQDGGEHPGRNASFN